jgi:putative hydrolase of the HAD superfamily
MENKQYRAVFIDWDDTIGDFLGAAKIALQEMYDNYNLSDYFASQEEFVSLYKPHNLELWDKYGKGLVSKEFLRIDRFLNPLLRGSKLAAHSATLTPKAYVLAEQLSYEFLALTTAYFSLLDGAEELIRYLAQKYPLTIITNGFVEVQYEKFEKSGMKDLFAHIVLSEEVGCQKPNPGIFEEALHLNGLRADEVVMIGDSWNSDIYGAQRVGIDQIWFRKSDEPLQEGQNATYIVKKLSEIMAIL